MQMHIDLVPGPPHNDDTLYNQAIQVIARYPAADMVDAIMTYPRMNVELDGSIDPNAWRWRWHEGGRSINVTFTIIPPQNEKDKICWGASTLELDCFVGDLISFWQNLRKTHPDIWLYYDGRVYTPNLFIEKLREMLEVKVIRDLV